MILFKRTNGIYYIKYHDDFGNEIRVSTKSKKKTDAIKFVSSYKEKLLKAETIKRISLFKSIKIYLEELKINSSKKYYANLQFTFDPFKEEIGDVLITNIHQHHINKFIQNKLIEGKSYMAHQQFRNLKIFFNWLKQNDYLLKSPFDKLKTPKLPEKKPTWITEDQLNEILLQVDNDVLKDIYKIYFNTGMRADELLSLNWKNIDLSEKLIHISNSETFKTKTGKERTIPMNEKVFQIIQRQPTRFTSGFLFVNKNKVKFNVDYVSKQFKKAVRKTNLDLDIHLHSLRHSFASNLARQGVSLFQIASLMGHSKITMTEKYSHLSPNSLKEIVNQL